MSILDGLPSNEKQVESALEHAALLTAELLDDPVLKDRKVIELLGKGLSIADILDIPERQLEAVFDKACQLVAAGELQKARKLFWMLCQIQPLEERYTYGLATTYQLEGNHRVAGRLYVLFLSLDADSIAGRLRLGECFLGAGEYDNAKAMFLSALRAAGEGAEEDENRSHARRMIEKCEKLQSGSLQ
jgi:tetratricopeptide (TPR) repeat protein